jgi:hypothetical protein
MPGLRHIGRSPILLAAQLLSAIAARGIAANA